jgi:hypothetical protein
MVPSFNIDEYAFMDNMPLSGWMWEFIRRNGINIAICEDIERLSNKIELWAIELDGRIVVDYKHATSPKSFIFLLERLENDLCVKPLLGRQDEFDERYFLRLRFSNNNSHVLAIPKPDFNYSAFTTRKPFIIGATAVKGYLFSDDLLYQQKNEEKSPYPSIASFIFKDDLTPVDATDTLYLGISLRANRDDIYKEIRDMVLKSQESKNIDVVRKKRYTKWKKYIVIYDLHKKYGYSLEKIAIYYPEVFPKDKELEDALRTTIDRYDRCLSLIDSRYKKYLNLPK